MKTIWVMIPTYNESSNIGLLIENIFSQNVPGHSVHVLVVDDNSPDGTSQIVLRYVQQRKDVHLITRTQNRGRGSAGVVGFKHALQQGADYVIEMDADFSHDPKYIPQLIASLDKGSDIAIGSRFVAGGSDIDRGLYRQLVTKCAGLYVRSLLRLAVRDVSSGYRAFKRHVFDAIRLDGLISTGPSIVLEILYKAVQKKFDIEEIPIQFVDRERGETKLNWKILLETAYTVKLLRKTTSK